VFARYPVTFAWDTEPEVIPEGRTWRELVAELDGPEVNWRIGHANGLLPPESLASALNTCRERHEGRYGCRVACVSGDLWACEQSASLLKLENHEETPPDLQAFWKRSCEARGSGSACGHMAKLEGEQTDAGKAWLKEARVRFDAICFALDDDPAFQREEHSTMRNSACQSSWLLLDGDERVATQKKYFDRACQFGRHFVHLDCPK
jgi:hypothetical protein